MRGQWHVCYGSGLSIIIIVNVCVCVCVYLYLTHRVMDHDLYSAHDAIGRVYIILNPLVESGSTHSSLEGWFPIFDTLHGQ